MTTLFDSAGYSSAGVWRRRLWAMALLKLVPSANSGVVDNLDQVCVMNPRANNPNVIRARSAPGKRKTVAFVWTR